MEPTVQGMSMYSVGLVEQSTSLLASQHPTYAIRVMLGTICLVYPNLLHIVQGSGAFIAA